MGLKNLGTIKKSLNEYQKRLIDISKNNNLISFKHSQRSIQHIRIIDEMPDFLYNKIIDNKTITFKPLPTDGGIPNDEKTPEFEKNLEQLKLIDEPYQEALENIDDENKSAIDEINKIERELRNQVRTEMGFLIQEEAEAMSNSMIAEKHGINPKHEMPEHDANTNKKKYLDKYIQTLMKPEEMIRKLNGLSSHIRSDIEESGINTLYITFGFLEWYEAKSSEKAIISPLVLLQLNIKRKESQTGYTFHIKTTGEEPEINLALAEKIKELGNGVVLPEFNEGDTPETYMAKITKWIEKLHIEDAKRWSVRRYITIGRFRFARIAMFHDLNKIDAHNNKTIQKMLGGSKENPNDALVEDYDIDDPKIETFAPLLITAADASQHSALIDAMKGENLAIKGPPGTGKSQTITNLIANALNKGKSVLFLAEKMAALNVVHNRLSKAGLGDYCLELHSTKVQKANVIESIANRLILGSKEDNGKELSSKLQEFKKHRSYISEYLDVLTWKFEHKDKTIYDYLWAMQRCKGQLGQLNSNFDKIKIPFAKANLIENTMEDHIEELEKIANLKDAVKKESVDGKHPWEFIDSFNLKAFELSGLKDAIEFLLETLKKLTEALCNSSNFFNFSLMTNSNKFESFFNNTEALAERSLSDLDSNIIDSLNSMKKCEDIMTFYKDIQTYKSLSKKIHTFKDMSESMLKIKDIEKEYLIAEELKVNDLTVEEIKSLVIGLEKNLEIWKENLEIFLSTGKNFDLPESKDMGLIYNLAEAYEHIILFPKEFLHYKTKKIINEANTKFLEAATDKQKEIQNLTKKQEMDFDISIMGEVQEIRTHAAILKDVNFFSFFNSSYRQAKKFYKSASIRKYKFNAHKAAEDLREIANTIENRHKIEQDKRLKEICGDYYDGINTEFEGMLKVNEWANNVRRNYTHRDTRSVRQWLLNFTHEEFEPIKDIIADDEFTTLKNEIIKIKDDVSQDTSSNEYLESLSVRIEKIKKIATELEIIASNKNITFLDISKEFSYIQEAVNVKISIEGNQTAKEVFSHNYAGVETNIESSQKTIQFIADCINIPEIKYNLENFIDNKFSKHWQNFIEERINIKEKYEILKEQIIEVKEYSTIQFYTIFGSENWKDVAYEDLLILFKNAIDKPDSLSDWIELNSSINEALKDERGKLLTVYIDNDIDFQTLPLAFEYIIYNAISHKIYEEYPILSTIKGINIEAARAKLKKLDKEILKLQKDNLCNTLNKKMPLDGIGRGSKKTWTEYHLLYNEIMKVKAHVPIRDLMKRAGKSIQNIKPCFLMSPMAVAQYLEHGNFSFDIVIIDEASQMRPEDALGSLARSKQAVIVGDPKQLPPTSFFKASRDSDEMAEELEEAIMDKALISFGTPRTLNRHYRSEHHSLIEFSNNQFYDDTLLVFPSPNKKTDYGIEHEYVKGTYNNRVNLKEAEKIVEAASNFMRKYPKRSLGIATMNQTQTTAIKLEMEKQIQEEHIHDYIDKWEQTLEPFFIKNLESVQGDERDTIFISTVYGPDKDNNIMQRFGPINSMYGHRRLNVLFTRAKKSMKIFTSLKAGDIKVKDGSSQGVKAFSEFISYASTGKMQEAKETHLPPDSDFEIFVKDRLESIGCEVHAQVGVAGFRIDLGVKHPKYPHRYLVGVECDGASYHSSRSARERDIMRQEVLESKGWNIYRIWSTDWFSDSDKEFRKLERYIDEKLEKEYSKIKSS